MRDVISFCHIPKTAGTTLDYLFRAYYGLYHFNVLTYPGNYSPTEKELHMAFKLCPWVKSVFGHGLFPAANYQLKDINLVWYAMFREPVARYKSHYIFLRQANMIQYSFLEWLQNSHQNNLQVKYIAGSENLAAAKKIILEKFKVIGLVEEYKKSLLCFEKFLDIPGLNNVVHHTKNVSSDKELIREVDQLAKHHEAKIISNNQLDIELYQFIKESIWPKQLNKLNEILLQESKNSSDERRTSRFVSFKWVLNVYLNLIYRTLVYKPIYKITCHEKSKL